MQFGDATGACLMRHTALPRNGGAMQNAAGNPIRKKVPAFSALPKIWLFYAHLLGAGSPRQPFSEMGIVQY